MLDDKAMLINLILATYESLTSLNILQCLLYQSY